MTLCFLLRNKRFPFTISVTTCTLYCIAVHYIAYISLLISFPHTNTNPMTIKYRKPTQYICAIRGLKIVSNRSRRYVNFLHNICQEITNKNLTYSNIRTTRIGIVLLYFLWLKTHRGTGQLITENHFLWKIIFTNVLNKICLTFVCGQMTYKQILSSVYLYTLCMTQMLDFVMISFMKNFL